ncbi:PREDICTED: uncharacterized protein LOC108967097 [Bactrocera latifrons]|uniref:Glucose facilitated diffusion protein n=1 Tax=Bactrocera latifrons TaxID=174628 RepID=A0A0K8W6P8_BACLA|nr:PREDICTED: uncharacterized protein LOC108967097 [Bactrocera latifrons]
MTTINPTNINKGRFWIDGPQTNALVSDVFIFITGGFHLAVSLGWSYTVYSLHFYYCWFIGVAIGCILAPLLINWKRRRLFIVSPILLVNLSAILTASVYYSTNTLIAARYLSGIAIGLTSVSFIMHASEIASEHSRGYCLCLEQVGLVGGAYVQMLYTGYWGSDVDFSPYCLQGIFCVVFGVIALLLTFTSIDSPILHLRNGDEPVALNCIVRLYRPPIMTNEKQVIFNKLKTYVDMNESMSLRQCFMQSLVPLLRILPYRCMLSFIFALPIVDAFKWSEGVSTAGSLVNWPPSIYGILSSLGVMVTFATIEAIGRKAVSLFSLLCVGGMTIGVGIIFNETMALINSTKMATACSLLMIAQIFGGIFAPSTTVYLGEAFPLRLKRYFIAFVVLVQYMVDLIIVCTFTFSPNNMFVYCLVTGLIICVACIIFAFTMPETRKNTLMEAQQQFSYGLHLRFY